MKLKSNFITQNVGNVQMMVSTDSSSFNGIVKSNKTAAFIVECLKTETTKQEIVKKMYEKYDAPIDVIEKDVENTLQKLIEIGAVDE